MRQLIVYHNPCIDGFSAALAASVGTKLNELPKPVFKPLGYGTKIDEGFVTDQELMDLDIVYFVDICPPKEELLEFSRRCEGFNTQVRVIDNHQTAINQFGEGKDQWIEIPGFENLKIILDNSRSGAMLAYDLFLSPFDYNKKYRPFFFLVSERDLWKESDLGFALTAALSVEVKSLESWESILNEFSLVGPERLIDRGFAILEKEKAVASEVCAKSIIFELSGIKCHLFLRQNRLRQNAETCSVNYFPMLRFQLLLK